MIRAVYRYFNHLRFNRKLFLSYLLVVIIPVSVLGAYAYWQSKTMLNMQMLQGLDKTVSTVSESMSRSTGQYNHLLRSMLFNGTFQKIVTNDYIDLVNLSRDLQSYLSPYVTMIANLDQDVEKVTVYAQGDVPEYGNLVQSAGRVREEWWYDEATEGTGSEIRWFYDGEIFATGTFPILFSPDRHFVYMRINEDSFFKPVSELTNEYGIAIVDQENQILYGNYGEWGLAADDIAGLIGLHDREILIDGKEFLLVSKQVEHAGWTIYCFVPIAQVASDAGSIIRATLVIIGVCMITLLAIITIFSKTMLRRIYKLNSLMKRVEVGNTNIRISSDSKDEIGQLTNQFGHMLVRFNALIEESYRSKIKQQEAEMKALQWQINPHFLYNTLSFINWQALRNGAEDISQVVTAMARFYRTALNRGHNMITVRDELDNIMSYIEIVQVMSEYRFDVEYRFDEAVYEYSTINLILQPLAENAIKHGIKQKREGSGLLKVSARLVGETIVFDIEDNGPGMSPETADAILSMNSSGYGLKNVHERLQLLFGAAFGVSVHSRLGEGTLMRITCPQYKTGSS
ncbi:sensor histidine kinase [Paenibacillus sp. J5C_2022]|uniref:sensor histidine kinase n=1 Tax=Paenibacillus sp. J5C2022 TaxID=2977129 RepID=UPI0021D03FD5|nr:sensor histidine kinase [Paenibacillus sp. J5C2022]MCU6709136.1 sensor histidine kinase [Paenibacillus sp. J5C2022]